MLLVKSVALQMNLQALVLLLPFFGLLEGIRHFPFLCLFSHGTVFFAISVSWILFRSLVDRVSAYNIWILLALYRFAILSGPTIPIIGEGDEEANDRYCTIYF